MLQHSDYVIYLQIALDQRLRQVKNFEKQFGATSAAYLALADEISRIRAAMDYHRTGGTEQQITAVEQLHPTKKR